MPYILIDTNTGWQNSHSNKNYKSDAAYYDCGWNYDLPSIELCDLSFNMWVIVKEKMPHSNKPDNSSNCFNNLIGWNRENAK